MKNNTFASSKGSTNRLTDVKYAKTAKQNTL